MAMKIPDHTLQIDGIILRQWTAGDAAWYVASRDEEVYKWTTEKRDLAVDEAARAIRQANDRDDVLCFAIIISVNGQLLGNIALALDAGKAPTGEIMFWLAPQARGQGIASKAVRLLCHWALNELDLEMITAKILPGNYRSCRVIENVGFHVFQPVSEQKQSDSHLWFAITKQSFNWNP